VIIAACALLAIGLVAYTFYVPAEIAAGPEKDRLAFLRERKDVVYENLRDLNFEHRAGKLSEGDFESLRGQLETEAAGLLSEIDALEKTS
jgi:hypothetical protein